MASESSQNATSAESVFMGAGGIDQTAEKLRTVEKQPRTRTTGRWIEQWRDTIAAEPEMPGVWARKDGGFRVRGRAVDGKTGKLREVNRALPDCKTARAAAAALETELAKVRAGNAAEQRRTIETFADFAVDVLAERVANGDIASAATRAKWDWAMRVHLFPAFGDVFVDRLETDDIKRWKASALKEYKPQTINTVLELLRQVTKAASSKYRIADPCREVANVNKRLHRTYTDEEPNSLKPTDVPRFLDEMRTRYPQHYAFVFLGFTTGLRPSSLRPLRRRGASADVKWDECKLLVRRSHTLKTEIMDSTKTNHDQKIALDERQLSVLRWHVQRMEAENARRAKRSADHAEKMLASDLLFPDRQHGGLRSPSCLDKAFADIGARIGLPYSVTPRSMRRTYQDLARAAKVADIVTRAISGHATPEMQEHYSTVSDSEVRAGLAAVIDIATGLRCAA